MAAPVPAVQNGILAANPHAATAMDRKLLDILACPATRQPLALLERDGLDALNRAIAAGGVRRRDDAPQSSAVDEALVTRDRKLVYRVDDGIPVLLAGEAIGTAQMPGFPGA
jgi:uncharacterized protein YbaR (Trm112 family)